MRKVLIALAVALVVIVGLVVFLATHEFDSPELGQRLLDKVGQATGVKITAKQFKLRLLSGLVLEGVEAAVTKDNRQLTLALDQLVFEHRLRPLLSGQIAVDKVLLDRPRIEVVESAPSSAPPGPGTEPGGAASSPEPTAKPPAPADSGAEPAPAGDDRSLSLELRELTIQDGALTLRREGRSGGVKLDGLTMNMSDVVVDPNARSLAGLSGRGEIRLASATLNTLTIKDALTRFELANAKFDMPELAFLSDYGRLTSKTSVDFNATPFVYHLEAVSDGIDVNKLLGAPGGFGGASVNLTADGEGTASTDLRAHGALKLAPGKLPSIPTLVGLERALSKNVLVDRPYKATDLKFALAKDTLTLSPFRVELERARLDLNGTAALAGPLDIDVALATPTEGVQLEGVSARVLETVADAEGWVSVPIHIGGTLEKPQIRPDGAALVAQTKQGIKREAREAATTAAERAKQKAAEALRNRRRP
jgi:hypothetical protein